MFTTNGEFVAVEHKTWERASTRNAACLQSHTATHMSLYDCDDEQKEN